MELVEGAVGEIEGYVEREAGSIRKGMGNEGEGIGEREDHADVLRGRFGERLGDERDAEVELRVVVGIASLDVVVGVVELDVEEVVEGGVGRMVLVVRVVGGDVDGVDVNIQGVVVAESIAWDA